MDQEIATLKLNINQLAGITGVHRQTVAARLKNVEPAPGSNSKLKLYLVTDILTELMIPTVSANIWDATGKLVLTNESRILSDLVTVGTPGATTGGINIDVTLPGSYAVAPAILGSQIIQNNNTKPPTIVNITAYSGCRFNGSSTRINAAPSTTSTGSAAGGTTTGIALTAINTTAFD
ncbi:DUF1441 family protein [Enterobacter asburiae]